MVWPPVDVCQLRGGRVKKFVGWTTIIQAVVLVKLLRLGEIGQNELHVPIRSSFTVATMPFSMLSL